MLFDDTYQTIEKPTEGVFRDRGSKFLSFAFPVNSETGLKTNLAVIVVRYFGGTLLGVPGLINAYKSATEDALKQANIIQKTVNDIYTIQFDYLQMNDVRRIIKDDDLAIISQAFDNNCCVQVAIRKTRVNGVLDKITKLDSVIVKFDKTV